MTDERFYDEKIAPELLRLMRLCEARGMSFLAVVEFEAAVGDTGTTAPARGRSDFLAQGAGIGQRMAHWAARANGNVDAFMFAVMRWAREHGHSSAVLTVLDRQGDLTKGT
jgi:hypothetical protein